MRSFLRSATWLAFGVLVLAPGAAAQSVRATTTLLGGWSTHGDLTPGLTPTVLADGWLAGFQAEIYPAAGPVGIRLDGFYTRRGLEDDGGDYNAFTADLGLTVRVPPLRSVGGIQPFGAITAGATMYRSVDDAPPFGAGAFGGDPVYRGHVTVGLGIDRELTYRTGLRIELADRIVFPSVGESPDTEGFPSVHTPM
ncbi:MAG: hypothetical protein ACOCUW_05230, partial [Gemmatimonadota bacterium]